MEMRSKMEMGMEMEIRMEFNEPTVEYTFFRTKKTVSVERGEL